jgi:hypothetical protein
VRRRGRRSASACSRGSGPAVGTGRARRRRGGVGAGGDDGDGAAGLDHETARRVGIGLLQAPGGLAVGGRAFGRGDLGSGRGAGDQGEAGEPECAAFSGRQSAGEHCRLHPHHLPGHSYTNCFSVSEAGKDFLVTIRRRSALRRREQLGTGRADDAVKLLPAGALPLRGSRAAAHQATINGHRYEAREGALSLSVDVIHGLCHDGMSGRAFADIIIVTANGRSPRLRRRAGARQGYLNAGATAPDRLAASGYHGAAGAQARGGLPCTSG